MAHVTRNDNGNRTFGIRNAAPDGTGDRWHSASVTAMHVAGKGVARLDVRAVSDEANFTRAELLELSEALKELAQAIPLDGEIPWVPVERSYEPFLVR